MLDGEPAAGPAEARDDLVGFESGDVKHAVYNERDQPNRHLLFEILPADLGGPSLVPGKKSGGTDAPA